MAARDAALEANAISEEIHHDHHDHHELADENANGEHEEEIEEAGAGGIGSAGRELLSGAALAQTIDQGYSEAFQHQPTNGGLVDADDSAVSGAADASAFLPEAVAAGAMISAGAAGAAVSEHSRGAAGARRARGAGSSNERDASGGAMADATRASSDVHTVEEAHDSKIQEVGVAPFNVDRAARCAVSRQHPGGFSPAGYVPGAHHDPDARPTCPPRACEQPPIVIASESIRLQFPSMVSNVVFSEASPRHQYLNKAPQDDAVCRSTTEDSHVEQVLAGNEEEQASRSRTDGPVLQFLVKSKRRAQI